MIEKIILWLTRHERRHQEILNELRYIKETIRLSIEGNESGREIMRQQRITMKAIYKAMGAE